jgi:Protein tyrosine and serine/threonine kinase/Leucine rich repeat
VHTLAQLRAGQLRGITRLDLSCGLTEFPPKIFDLADSLEILNLSDNALTDLPDDFPRLHKLRVIFCSNNRFTHVPEVLGRCPQLTMVGFKANQIHTLSANALPPALRWLILTDNQLTSLPDELGRCTQLQKLMLSGNRLTTLPASMSACTALELVRIASNQFRALPEWLLYLPKLSWLAYADNPFCAELEADVLARQAAQLRHISWQDLRLKEQLGQGASGVIYRALLNDANNDQQEVAVKLFKSAVTSDGLPECEMAACMVAGDHPNLIGVTGILSEHPKASYGLIMRLIDARFRNLAGPPSLASCTRDIYAEDTRFPFEVALNIAKGIASAAAHLHSNGILHGDLYAHNIMVTEQGESLLGDFGAASFVDMSDTQTALALQRLEVHAFGCLLEELLERSDENGESAKCIESLRTLQARCMEQTPSKRPSFLEITEWFNNTGAKSHSTRF